MSDRLKSIIFLLTLISGLAYYTYRYFQEKPFNPTATVFEDANIKSARPLKLKLANSIYYAVAIDWDNTGKVSQENILKGEDDIFAVGDADGHFRWLTVTFDASDQLNDYVHTLFPFQDLTKEQKEFFSKADPEFRKLHLIRIANNMSAHRVSKIEDSGIASITLFKPNVAPKKAGATLQIGAAILHNNTQRAIVLVPMSLLPDYS